MADTQISDFYSTLRFLLGDHDTTVQGYSDLVLHGAVQSCIRLNKVPGYTLAVGLNTITPELTDPNQWALVAYHTVKGFVDSRPDKYSFKTRAAGVTFGAWRTFLDELKQNIYRLECGDMFSSWQNYYTWLAGMSGLPLMTVMSRLTVQAPFYDVGISTDGITVGETT